MSMTHKINPLTTMEKGRKLDVSAVLLARAGNGKGIPISSGFKPISRFYQTFPIQARLFKCFIRLFRTIEVLSPRYVSRNT